MRTGMSESALTIVDGTAVGGSVIDLYLGCGFSEIETDSSRMLLRRPNGQWGHHDVRTKVISVDASASPFGFFALGRDGVVSIGNETGISFESIREAGTGRDKCGYVKRIKKIGDALYVCGDLHQVYFRGPKEWIRIDSGIR